MTTDNRTKEIDSVKSLKCSAAAHRMHARNDPYKITEAAREGFEERFRRMVPEELWTRDPTEAARIAAHHRAAYFAALTAKSIEARRRKRRDTAPEVVS